MKDIKLLLTIGLFVAFFSCSKEKSKDQSSPKRSSIITENGQISKNLADDSLFVKFDKANYEMNIDFIKHSSNKVDREKSKKVNNDLRNHKFKTLKEFAIAKEKIGYSDYYKRRQILFNFLKTKKDLFNKYPELVNSKQSVFLAFYDQNRMYKISSEDFYDHLQISKEEIAEIGAKANEVAFNEYKSNMMEALNLTTSLTLNISNRTTFSENRIIYYNDGFEDSNAIEDFLKFEKFADSMTFALSSAIEGHRNSYFGLLDEKKSKEMKKI